MLPTPDLSHLTKDDFEHVYEPAEDTFILLDALEIEAEELRTRNPRVCVEIGSGSGCVSTFVSQIIGPRNCLYICTDINARASRCSLLTGEKNHVTLECISTSLLGPMYRRLKHNIDLLIFNPPYVPTYDQEARFAQGEKDIAGSWAGGIDGMTITNLVLDSLTDVLSDSGRFYLVAVKDNDVPGIQTRMLAKGLDSEIVLERRAGREYLYVLKLYREANTQITT